MKSWEKEAGKAQVVCHCSVLAAMATQRLRDGQGTHHTGVPPGLCTFYDCLPPFRLETVGRPLMLSLELQVRPSGERRGPTPRPGPISGAAG